jgi:hypothetical protein
MTTESSELNTIKVVDNSTKSGDKSPEYILWFVRLGYVSPQKAKFLVFGSIFGILGLSFLLSTIKNEINFLAILILLIVALTPMIFGKKELYRWYALYMFLAFYDLLGVIQLYIVPEPNMSTLYYFDKYTFGVFFDLTPPSYYFYENRLPILDILLGIFYVGHIIFPPLMIIYLRKYHENHFDELAWSALILASISFTFFVFIPTAPPWYTYWYGFNPGYVDDITIFEATAGLWYTDKVLGISLFAPIMWEMTSAKFAAFPSLHVGTPAYIFFSFRKFKLKRPSNFLLIYLIAMCFTVVYLNHHWVADAIAGVLIGWISVRLSSKLYG